MLLHKLLPYLFYPITWVVVLLTAGLFLLWRARTRAALRVLVAAWLIVIVAASPGVANFLWYALERQYPQQAPEKLPAAGAIVLLGGGIELPAPPRVMPDLNDAADRVWYAAELFHAGKAPLIVVSGGQVFPNPGLQTEAEYHLQLLMRMGVPQNAIVLESASSNTADNAVLTAQTLKERDIDSVLLVTSAMHMPRASFLFRETGLMVIPATCDVRISTVKEPAILGLLPSAHAFSTTESALREWMGILIYRARVYWR